MIVDNATYCIHKIMAQPREWAEVSRVIRNMGGRLYGAWRSQIGRPRDEVTAITRWATEGEAETADAALHEALPPVRFLSTRMMRPTLRPVDGARPIRQGNYAFRWFTTPDGHMPEFLDLCAGAWPGFEAAYDSQVIGLWQLVGGPVGMTQTLLLTRRPDLAMWERSKLPAGQAEQEVRAKLSRRYDLCEDTEVYTTTLLTATDAQDSARWT
ncbi:MAG: hypothetical protein ACKVH0_01440 [Alphaproteobacteria bacterium]